MNHYLDLAELTSDQVWNLLDVAVQLKREYKARGNRPILANKTLAMLFMKPSLRTRVSFELGMVQLGGYAMYLGPNEIKMGGRESVADVARVLSGYVDGVMARVFSHQHILDLASYGSVPIINGLSEFNHPAQALTDLLTMYELFGRLEGLKVAYVGDGNNVTRSLMRGAALTGMHFVSAAPDGYQLSGDDYETAMEMRVSADQTIAFVNDPVEAVRDVDVIYTDVWTSMGQEAETAERLKVFPPFQINARLLSHAPAHTKVLHCLPAHRGEEITDEVADGEQSAMFPQAENRLHAQKAILATLLS